MLREAGLRVTASAAAVLSAVHDHPHADTDSIIGVVREDLGDVSHQAVYDVLRALTDRRAGAPHPAGGLRGPLRGAGRRQPPPPGLPRRAARSVDVDCAVGDTPCLTAADDSGYEIDEAEVVYWGRCPRCAAARRHQAMDRSTRHPWERTRQEKDRRV